jgi:galactokinase
VDLAQHFDGVYGSRLTGGGFGGCIVTLAEHDRLQALMEHLKTEYYKATTGKDCDSFETCESWSSSQSEGN